MRLAVPDRFARRPRVRQIGTKQYEVAIVVLAYVVADEPQATGIERQRQLQLGMMVLPPLERDPSWSRFYMRQEASWACRSSRETASLGANHAQKARIVSEFAI